MDPGVVPVAPAVLMLRGTRWSVNDPYNPANDVRFFDRRVTIGERNLDPSSFATHEAKTALSVWDASIALAKYLEVAPDMRREEWPTKRVIEIGAGCGLVGIVLGLQGARVTITDLGEVLPNIQMNVNANKAEEGQEMNIKVTELRWGEELGDTVRSEGPFDLIVASDVIWLDHLLQPLVDTFTRLMDLRRDTPDVGGDDAGRSAGANDGDDDEEGHGGTQLNASGPATQPATKRTGEIILAHETRSLQVEHKFFRLMEAAGFAVTRVDYELLHPAYRAKDIAIYRITSPSETHDTEIHAQQNLDGGPMPTTTTAQALVPGRT